MPTSKFIWQELDRLSGPNGYKDFCRVYALPFTSDITSQDPIRLLHIHPTFYQGGKNLQPNSSPMRPKRYIPCSVPSAKARGGRWISLDGPRTSIWIPAADPELRGGIVFGGIHGDELATPEIVLEVCEVLLGTLMAVNLGINPAPFKEGNYELSGDELRDIVSRTELYVVPLLCPFGRDNETRLNKNKTNLNRNFPFLWVKHYQEDAYYTTLAPKVQVLSPANSPEAGPRQMSEEETQCAVQLHMAVEVNLHLDCHTDQLPSARYPWGCEGTQTTNAADVWANGDNRADGARAAYSASVATASAPGGTYDEYMPPETLAVLAAGGNAVVLATGQAGRPWIADHALIEIKNAVFPFEVQHIHAYVGASDDFAFSLDICNMRSYTLEANSPSIVSVEGIDAGQRLAVRAHPDRRQYYVAILALLNWYALDVKGGRVRRTIRRKYYHCNSAALWSQYWSKLPRVPPMPLPPRSPLSPSKLGRMKSIFHPLNLLNRLLARFGLQVNKTVSSSSQPNAAQLHTLRLSTAVATGGDKVRGTLLDSSKDFMAIVPSSFAISLHVPPKPGVLGVFTFYVSHIRFLSSTVLEFTVPPVGIGNIASMIPPDSYVVRCYHGSWSVDSERPLSLR